MKINTENKIKLVPVYKSYLNTKGFSYKLFLNLCYISWWEKKGNSYEFSLKYITYSKLAAEVKLSDKLISSQLKNFCYRIKFDEYENKHLYFNSPINNFIKIPLHRIDLLKDQEEMLIRTYILLYSYGESSDIYGLTNKQILEAIGYSSVSKNNEVKLKKVMDKLQELNFIKREVVFNGKRKYSIYHKIQR